MGQARENKDSSKVAFDFTPKTPKVLPVKSKGKRKIQYLYSSSSKTTTATDCTDRIPGIRLKSTEDSRRTVEYYKAGLHNVTKWTVIRTSTRL